MQFTERVKKIM